MVLCLCLTLTKGQVSVLQGQLGASDKMLPLIIREQILQIFSFYFLTLMYLGRKLLKNERLIPCRTCGEGAQEDSRRIRWAGLISPLAAWSSFLPLLSYPSALETRVVFLVTNHLSPLPGESAWQEHTWVRLVGLRLSQDRPQRQTAHELLWIVAS